MTEAITNPPVIPPAPPPVSASPGVFGTKIPTTVAFAIAVLLFFMPFVDIKCNTMSLQTVSGLKLATGFEVNTGSNNNSLFGKMDDWNMGNKKTDVKEGRQEDPNMFALAALILGVVGLVLSFANTNAIGGLVTGVVSAVALIGLLIDIRGKLNKELTGSSELGGDVVISVDFTPWFYISLLAFLAAAFFSYKRLKGK